MMKKYFALLLLIFLTPYYGSPVSEPKKKKKPSTSKSFQTTAQNRYARWLTFTSFGSACGAGALTSLALWTYLNKGNRGKMFTVFRKDAKDALAFFEKETKKNPDLKLEQCIDYEPPKLKKNFATQSNASHKPYEQDDDNSDIEVPQKRKKKPKHMRNQFRYHGESNQPNFLQEQTGTEIDLALEEEKEKEYKNQTYEPSQNNTNTSKKYDWDSDLD